MRPLQNYSRNLLFAGLILLIGLLAPFLSPASAAERPVLRVGYVEEPSYAFKNSQGEYDGYTVELLYNIASHGNFTLQFVEFSGYDQEDQALKDGKIDLEGTVPYSTEREKQFLLSETATLNIPLTLLVRDNDDRFTFGDNQSVNKMRVGVIKNDATAEAFSEWCQRNNLQPQLVYYADYKQLLAALNDGSIDGITNGNELLAGGQRLLYYSHVSCYAIFNKQRHDVKQLFDTAFRLALSESPMLEEQLHNEYLVNESINLDLITKSEKAFLAAQHNIVVAMQAPNPPYTFTGGGGKLTGILPEYYALLSKATGLQFTFKTYPTESAAMAAVRKGQAQVLGLFSGTQAGAYKNNLRLINMSGNRNLVRIDKFGYAGKKAAVTARNLSFLQQRLTDQNYDFVAFQDNEACYQALKAGQVDSILCTDIAASWLFNNHRTEGYSMVPLIHTKKLYIAVPANADNSLYTILSRGARKIAPQYNGLVIANISPKANLSNFLARLPYWGLALFAGVMAILVILLAVLVFLLVRRYREKSLLDAQEAENDKEKIRLEALEKNAEEKNQFFANISHDLRTPLNAILGFSHLARQTDNTTEQKTYLEKINSAGQLMLDLVNDTLIMSKLKSGKLELHLEPLPHADILFAPVLDVVREAATVKNISLQVDASQALNRPTLGDKLNLRKILLNLLTNAIKYTPAGGHIKVTIWNETAADGGIDSLFSVQDDGIGVAPEFQERIFEPFTQEKRPGYENFGTGLGLDIVKQLIKLMGGTITLDSVPNQGSTFTVRLRFALVPAGAETAAARTGNQTGAVDVQAEAAATAAEKTARLQKLRGRKILMCEDNLMNREITAALLKSQGMQVVMANDGRQGVDTFSASAPGELTAILMDLRMPVLDGYEATKEIRALSRPDAKTVPIIALTAETFTEDIQRCLDCGMNNHVAKPLVPDVLFATLAQYIK